jgi:hypothetical protein
MREHFSECTRETETRGNGGTIGDGECTQRNTLFIRILRLLICEKQTGSPRGIKGGTQINSHCGAQ